MSRCPLSSIAVTKKPHDTREDPHGEADNDAGNFRVDRVFPGPPSAPRQGSQGNPALREARRARTPSVVPLASGDLGDTEIALRRQLSRLQRQMSDAQRELANKDDELAVEVEKRIDAVEAHDQLVEANNELQDRLQELTAYHQRTQGIEQRLLDAVNAAEELGRARDRERDLRSDALTRVDEVTAVLDEQQALWRSERAKLEAQTASEAERNEQERKAATEAATAAHAAAIAREKESHEHEIAQLKASNESSLAMLRGELEPKALAALGLAEERQKLVDELAAVKTEHARTLAEKDEAHGRAMAAEAERSTMDRATSARHHAAEVARVTSERDAHALTIDQAKRSAEAREKHWEEVAEGIREQHKQAQREAGEARETTARLESEKVIAEARIDALSEQIEKLVDEKRQLRTQLEATEAEVRRNSLDRRRFVAYLEEGLAMLGALPPQPPDDAEIEISHEPEASDEGEALPDAPPRP